MDGIGSSQGMGAPAQLDTLTLGSDQRPANPPTSKVEWCSKDGYRYVINAEDSDFVIYELCRKDDGTQVRRRFDKDQYQRLLSTPIQSICETDRFAYVVKFRNTSGEYAIPYGWIKKETMSQKEPVSDSQDGGVGPEPDETGLPLAAHECFPIAVSSVSEVAGQGSVAAPQSVGGVGASSVVQNPCPHYVLIKDSTFLFYRLSGESSGDRKIKLLTKDGLDGKEIEAIQEISNKPRLDQKYRNCLGDVLQIKFVGNDDLYVVPRGSLTAYLGEARLKINDPTFEFYCQGGQPHWKLNARFLKGKTVCVMQNQAANFPLYHYLQVTDDSRKYIVHQRFVDRTSV